MSTAPMGFALPVDDRNDLVAPILRSVLLMTLTLCVVFPHSFQAVTAGMLVVTTMLSLLAMRRSAWLDQLLLTYLLGVIITAFYVWLGITHRAPRVAVTQTLVVYIAAPMMWLTIGTTMFQQFGLRRVVQTLVRLTWLAVFSVAAFFWAFLTFGKRSVSFLLEDANVNVSGGFAGANILVYGSLIFLSGAIFAQPAVIKNRFLRIILPGLVLVCALTSGRSALILAVPVGFLVGAVLRSRVNGPTAIQGEADLTVEREPKAKRRSVLLPTLVLGVVTAVVIVVTDIFVDSFDLTVIFNSFYRELMSGGGSERTEQVSALWEGVQKSYGLGLGHGIGVPYLRSAEFPWRYEVIPLASLLRVGVLGTVVYMSTFLLYGGTFLKRMGEKELRPEDIYMMGGFVSSALATFTNPYIESFIFQWMYFLPVLSLGTKVLSKVNEQTD